ncbi:MAG: LrgB family protein [Rikenellaceae bacterium]
MMFQNNELPMLCLNLCAFVIGAWVIKVSKIKFLNTFVVALLLVVGALQLLRIDYQSYFEGSRIISFLLGPSVVALGYMLHKQVAVIRRSIVPIVISVTLGAALNILLVNLILLYFGVDKAIIYSVQPKSVTTAIAVTLSEQNGGVVSLTAIVTAFTGILGSIVGPTFLRLFRITSPVARGLAMGTAAHGIGTARALEMGAKEGAVAGLAIGLMGTITSIVLLLLKDFMLVA